MSIQSDIYVGTSLTIRTFTSSKHIASKSHMAVWTRKVSDDTWVQMDSSLYELINNTCVLNSVLNSLEYDGLEVRVADAPDELSSSLSDISVVAGIADDIVIVSSLKDEIEEVVSMSTVLTTIYNDKETLDSIYADKAKLDSIYNDKVKLDSLYADKVKLDTIYADSAKINSLYADKATLDSLFADKVTLDSLYSDKATLDSLYADKVKLDALYAKLNELHDIYANLSEILVASNYASEASTSASEAAASAILAASYVPNPMAISLVGNTTGVELSEVIITDTEWTDVGVYNPTVSAGSVVDNADGTYTVTLPDYSVATSINFILGGSLTGYDDNLQSHTITVTNTVVSTPDFTGSPTSGNEGSTILLTDLNWESGTTYVVSISQPGFTIVDNNNSTYSITLADYAVSNLGTVSIYGTRAGDITSGTTYWGITVLEVTLEEDTAVTFNFATDTENNEGFE